MAKYIFLFFLGFLLSGTTAIAQTETIEEIQDTVQAVQAPVEEEEYEEVIEKVEVKDTFLFANTTTVSADTMNDIKQDKKFAYVKNLDSLLKDYQKKQDDKAKNLSNNTSSTVKRKNGPSFMDKVLGGGTFQVILWILAACFVGVVIYQLLKGDGLFQKKSAKSDVRETPAEEEELMQQDNFDLLIDKAIADKDYRLAVRYHFIKALQTLWNKNHIQYETDKTNSQYVYEVPQHFRNDFSKLIFQYEYVWYGHFDINEDQYRRVREGFNDFNKKI